MSTSDSYLKGPELFLDPETSSKLTQQHLEHVFQGYPSLLIDLVHPARRPPFFKINFRTIQSAEKALATLNGRPLHVPGLEEPVALEFILKSPNKATSRHRIVPPTVAPRVIKDWDGTESAEALYDKLRLYGPLYEVISDHVVGGIARFWSEKAAVKATEGLAGRLTLETYDPCTIFCSNLHPSVDELDLDLFFGQDGTITETVLIRNPNGQSGHRARISFLTESSAWTAMHEMHGRKIHGQTVSVSYHVPQPGTAPDQQTSPGQHEGKQESDVRLDDKGNGWWDISGVGKPNPEPSCAPEEKQNESFKPPNELTVAVMLGIIEDLRAQMQLSAQREACATVQLNEVRSQLHDMTSASETATRLHAQELGEMRGMMDQLRVRLERAERALDAEKSKVRDFEEANRAAEVEEMRRRMTAMAEEEQQRKAAEARERASREQEEKLRKEREEKERREAQERARLARERAEQERLARERERARQWKTATVQAEQRCRDRDMQMRGTGPWTLAKALLRLQSVMDEFDKTKFSETLPLTMGAIPWPVFIDPLHLQMTDISWDAVEALFHQLHRAPNMTFPIHKALVRRAMLMFHPDGWKAKLKSVMDPDERERLEAAGNIVSQAMTGLWNELSATTK
uniref:Polyadenylate-binding protein 1 n=1 Tax=Mycena chlorophos TaxID=658473 RepID=A0ABQ0LTV1_MYCCL|nr:polyadenylate-binding protein 1 [Mycena chlorophos]